MTTGKGYYLTADMSQASPCCQVALGRLCVASIPSRSRKILFAAANFLSSSPARLWMHRTFQGVEWGIGSLTGNPKGHDMVVDSKATPLSNKSIIRHDSAWSTRRNLRYTQKLPFLSKLRVVLAMRTLSRACCSAVVASFSCQKDGNILAQLSGFTGSGAPLDSSTAFCVPSVSYLIQRLLVRARLHKAWLNACCR